MRRSLVFGILVLAVCLAVTGCGANRVGQGISDYVNKDILPISELETRALARYASVVGKNYTSDEAVYDALKNDVIPLYERFLNDLKRIRPTEKEVVRLHGLLVSGAENIYQGFRLKMVGIEQKDDSIIRAGNSKIEEGRKENERWREELIASAKKHGVYKEEKKKGSSDK